MKGFQRNRIRYYLTVGGSIFALVGFLSVAISQRREAQKSDMPLPPPTPKPARQSSSRELGSGILGLARMKLQSAVAAMTPAPPTTGFALPYAGSVAAVDAPAFSVTNTDPGGQKPGGGSNIPMGIAATGVIGIFGRSPTAQGTGVLGICSDGSGVSGSSIAGNAIQGNSGPTGSGVMGENRIADTHGWLGTPDYAFRGTNGSLTDAFIASKTNALYGKTNVADGQAILGIADSGTRAVGIFGISANGWAGYFRGKVSVTGTLVAPSKQFTIDHPLEPATKTLSHACVESDSLKNIYDGIAICDQAGEAVVKLPAWFEALNNEFRYQLTCIGGYAPLFISREIRDQEFAIAGGRKGLRVSWQVTGIRRDSYAKSHPLQVEGKK